MFYKMVNNGVLTNFNYEKTVLSSSVKCKSKETEKTNKTKQNKGRVRD